MKILKKNYFSIMLLDCFTIPCVMLLSYIFLKTRYYIKQFFGVALCIIGLIILLISDYKFNKRNEGNYQ